MHGFPGSLEHEKPSSLGVQMQTWVRLSNDKVYLSSAHTYRAARRQTWPGGTGRWRGWRHSGTQGVLDLRGRPDFSRFDPSPGEAPL